MQRVKSLTAKPGGGSAGGVVRYAQNERADVERESDGRLDVSPQLAQGYYAAGESPSFWGGSLTAELGLAEGAPVSADALEALLDGRRPDNNNRRFAKKQSTRRMGADISYSAPKSVSIAALALGDARIYEAHDCAVRAAMSLVEREYATARYGRGGGDVEHSGALVYGAYRHEDARTVDDIADPQLHTHCITANVTRGRDGKLRGLDLAFGENGIKLGGAAYQAELACGLRELGYTLRETDDAFEIDGITDAQIEAFSARRSQIDNALMERFGVTRDDATEAQKTAATLATRQSKSQLSREEQRAEWRERAHELGITLRAPAVSRPAEAAQRPAVDLADALDHLSERANIIGRDDLRLHALREHVHLGVTLDDIDAQIDALLDGKTLYRAGESGYVTREALERETHILRAAQAGRGTLGAMASEKAALRQIERAERMQGFKFSAGQRNAVAQALQTRDKISGIVGAAGAGKTTSMRAVVEYAQAHGIAVSGIAPSAAAARELKGAGARTTETLAAFALKRTDPAAPPRLVMLDEAGMVSARDMQRVIEKLRPQDRLLLVGDPKQIAAVEAGSPFAQMMREGVIECAQIDEINRQKDSNLRAVAQAFADGEPARALALATPYIHETPLDRIDDETKTEFRARVREQIADDAAAAYLARAPEQRRETLVLAATNDTRRAINERVRAGLKRRGEIAANDGVVISALDRADMTKSQMRQAKSYREGMVIRWRDKRASHSQIVESVDRERGVLLVRDEATGRRGRLAAKDVEQRRAQIFTQRDMSLVEGDRVIVTAGDRAARTETGMTGTVRSIGATGIAEVEIDYTPPAPRGRARRMIDRLLGRQRPEGEGPQIVEIDASSAHALDHAYAVTVHRSQGRTVDHVIVAGEASRVSTAEAAYVALSRERHGLEIYTNDAEALKKSWGRYAERETARDAANVRVRDRAAAIDDVQAARDEVRAEMERAHEQQQERERERTIEFEM